MKISREFAYCLSLLFGIFAITGNLLGGYWLKMNMYLVLGLWVYDWFSWENKKSPAEHSPVVPNLVLILHVLVHTLAIASLIYGTHAQLIPARQFWRAVLSTGIASGVSGILVAHELIHRKGRAWRYAGLWNLLLVNYGHWNIAHVHIHHRFVGTAADPSTARKWETIYDFVVRSIVMNLVLSIQVEAKRLRRLGRFGYGWSNRVLACLIAQLAIAGMLYVLLGPRVLLAHLEQSFLAILFLEVVNYFEHYGLERQPGERLTPALSWHTDAVSDRFLMLELNRHADHHMRASQPYHELVSHQESPTLPAGYWGMMPLMLVPPLWFLVMHPRLARVKIREATREKPARLAA